MRLADDLSQEPKEQKENRMNQKIGCTVKKKDQQILFFNKPNYSPINLIKQRKLQDCPDTKNGNKCQRTIKKERTNQQYHLACPKNFSKKF